MTKTPEYKKRATRNWQKKSDVKSKIISVELADYIDTNYVQGQRIAGTREMAKKLKSLKEGVKKNERN